MVGVCIVGRPVARNTNQRTIVEVTRLCTDGTPNACSALYGAAARAAKALGYEKIQTFILASEPGTSLRATGWVCEGESAGGQWSCSTRHRPADFDGSRPLEAKTRWAKVLNPPMDFAVVGTVDK